MKNPAESANVTGNLSEHGSSPAARFRTRTVAPERPPPPPLFVLLLLALSCLVLLPLLFLKAVVVTGMVVVVVTSSALLLPRLNTESTNALPLSPSPPPLMASNSPAIAAVRYR